MSIAVQAPRREKPFPDLTECINHPSGYFALSPRKDRFTVTDIPGLIAYKEHGKHLIVMGGVACSRNVSRAAFGLFSGRGG